MKDMKLKALRMRSGNPKRRHKDGKCVRWLIRFADKDTCDVECRDSFGHTKWSVRLSGAISDYRQAKHIAKDYLKGCGLPEGVSGMINEVKKLA